MIILLLNLLLGIRSCLIDTRLLRSPLGLGPSHLLSSTDRKVWCEARRGVQIPSCESDCHDRDDTFHKILDSNISQAYIWHPESVEMDNSFSHSLHLCHHSHLSGDITRSVQAIATTLGTCCERKLLEPRSRHPQWLL